MQISKLLSSFWSVLLYFGLPVVSLYHTVQQTPFLSYTRKEAVGIEKLADNLLMPVHYIIAGQTIEKISYDNSYERDFRFDYHNNLTRNTLLSVIGFPISCVVGYLLKSFVFLDKNIRKEYQNISDFFSSTRIISNNQQYIREGVSIPEWENLPLIQSLGYEKETPSSILENKDFELFKQVVQILRKEKILFWMDCGSCLGAYRYGGAIPWDDDYDIAVLRPDFSNIMHALQRLDKTKYQVQDWSSRLFPKSYIRIYEKETNNHMDIYHFTLDEETKELQYLLSNEFSDFMPEFWKIRERRFKAPTKISTIFPLKRIMFDGIEVTVPNDIKKYLQARYGDDLRPAKIYNPSTNRYEKDLSHPYWQRAYVH